MTIDQLKAAIERRGYTVDRLPLKEPVAGYALLYIFRGDWFVRCPVSFADLDQMIMSVSQLAERFVMPLSKGQHHMCCAQCGEPLLVFKVTDNAVVLKLLQTSTKPSLMLVNGIPQPDPSIMKDAMQRGSYIQYRSAKAGPDSDVLNVCSGCGIELNHQTVIEIKDETE